MARAHQRVSFLTPRGISGVEVMLTTYSGAPMRPYVAHGFVLSLMVEGDVELRLGTQVQRVRSGSVVLIEPGDLVAEIARRSPTARVSTIVIESAAFMRPMDVPLPFPSSSVRSGVVADIAVKRALRRLVDSISSDHEEHEQRVRYTALLAAMLGYDNDRGAGDVAAVVRRARSILHDRWSENVPLVELSREVGTDRFYLIRAFSRALGVTPHAYQVLLRVARARSLLRAGRSLRDTSVDAGFADQSHLSRHFHRVVGMPPGRYARLARG